MYGCTDDKDPSTMSNFTIDLEYLDIFSVVIYSEYGFTSKNRVCEQNDDESMLEIYLISFKNLSDCN
jgi:hypothetical protein